MNTIQLGDLAIEVELKDIKNIHLSVFPPMGRVHISAPERMDLDTIRVFAIAKLKWIRKQQEAFKKQQRETPREYLTRESHYFLGKRYLLKVVEKEVSLFVGFGDVIGRDFQWQRVKGYRVIVVHIQPDEDLLLRLPVEGRLQGSL